MPAAAAAAGGAPPPGAAPPAAPGAPPAAAAASDAPAEPPAPPRPLGWRTRELLTFPFPGGGAAGGGAAALAAAREALTERAAARLEDAQAQALRAATRAWSTVSGNGAEALSATEEHADDAVEGPEDLHLAQCEARPSCGAQRWRGGVCGARGTRRGARRAALRALRAGALPRAAARRATCAAAGRRRRLRARAQALGRSSGARAGAAHTTAAAPLAFAAVFLRADALPRHHTHATRRRRWWRCTRTTSPVRSGCAARSVRAHTRTHTHERRPLSVFFSPSFSFSCAPSHAPLLLAARRAHAAVQGAAERAAARGRGVRGAAGRHKTSGALQAKVRRFASSCVMRHHARAALPAAAALLRCCAAACYCLLRWRARARAHTRPHACAHARTHTL
jgi:hypothetical protein